MPLSDDFNKQLEEAFDLPGETGTYQSLLQKHENHFQSLVEKHPPIDIDQTNLKNMGYEGSMYFGKPA